MIIFLFMSYISIPLFKSISLPAISWLKFLNLYDNVSTNFDWLIHKIIEQWCQYIYTMSRHLWLYFRINCSIQIASKYYILSKRISKMHKTCRTISIKSNNEFDRLQLQYTWCTQNFIKTTNYFCVINFINFSDNGNDQ